VGTIGKQQDRNAERFYVLVTASRWIVSPFAIWSLSKNCPKGQEHEKPS
jgi:hypothetical protein